MKASLILSFFCLHWAIVSSGVQRETVNGRIAEQRGTGTYLRRGNLVEEEAILDDVRRTSSGPQDGRQKSRAHETGLTRQKMGSVEEESSSSTDWGGFFFREQEPREEASDLPPLISMLRSRLREPESIDKSELQNRHRRSLDLYSNSDNALTIDDSIDEAEVRKILANAKARLSSVKLDSMGMFQDSSFGNDWLSFVLPTRSGTFTDMLFKSQTEDFDWDTHDFDVNTNWMNSEHLSNVKENVNSHEVIEAKRKDSLEDYKSSHSKWNMGMNEEYSGQLRTETSWSNRDKSWQTEAESDRKNVIAPESLANEAGKSGSNAIRDHNQWDEGRLIKSDEDRNGKEDYRDIKVNVKNGETLFGDSRIDNTMVVGSDKPSTAELPVKIPEAHNKARQNKRPSNDKSLFISDPLVLLPKLEGVGRHMKKSEESMAHESTPRKVHEGLQDRNSVGNEVQRNVTESYLDQKSADDESSPDNVIDDPLRETAITRDRKTSSVELREDSSGANPLEAEDPDALALVRLIEELSKLREQLNSGFDKNDRNLPLRSSRLGARQDVHEKRDKHGVPAETSDDLVMEERGRGNVHDDREEQRQPVNGHYDSLGDYDYTMAVGGDVKHDWSSVNARQDTVTVPYLTKEQLRVGNWRGMKYPGREVSSSEKVGTEEHESRRVSEVSVSEVENEIENTGVNDVNRLKSGSVTSMEWIPGIESKGREEYDMSDRVETKSVMEHSRETGTDLQTTNEGNRLKLKDLKGKKLDPEVAVGRFEAESLGTKDAKRNKFGSLNMEGKEFEWDGAEGEKIWGENLENGKFEAGGPEGRKAWSKELGREKYDSEKLDKKKSGSMNLGKEEARLPVVEKFKPLPDYTLSNVNKSPMENEQKSEQSVSYGAQVNGRKNSIPEYDKVSTKEGSNKSSEHDKEIIQINYSDLEKEKRRRMEVKGSEDNHYGDITVSSGGNERYNEDFWNRGTRYEQEDVYNIHNNAFDAFHDSSSGSDYPKYRITSRKRPLNADVERNTYENRGEQYEKLISYGETLKDLNDDKTSASKYNLEERQTEAGAIRSGKDEAKELELSSSKDDAKERNINGEEGEEKLSWAPKINGRQGEKDDEDDVTSKWITDKDILSVEEDEALIKRGKYLQTDRSLSGTANSAGEIFANAEIHEKNNKARVLSTKTNITGEEPFYHAGVHKEQNEELKNYEIYVPSTKEYKLNELSATSNIARDQIPDNTVNTSDWVNSVNKISDPLQRYGDKTLSLDSGANQGTSLLDDVGAKSLEDPEGNDVSVVATAKAHVAELQDENKGFRWSENDTSGVEAGRSAESNSGTSATVNRTADKDQIEIRGSLVNLSELSSTDVHAPEYSYRWSKNDNPSVVSHRASLNEDKGNNNEDSRLGEMSDVGKESEKESDIESEGKSGSAAENNLRNGPGKVSAEEFGRESERESGVWSSKESLGGSEMEPETVSAIISENVSGKKSIKESKEVVSPGGKIFESDLRNQFNETEPGMKSEMESKGGPESVSSNEPGKLPGKESIIGTEISDKGLGTASENESERESNVVSSEEDETKLGNNSEEGSGEVPGGESEPELGKQPGTDDDEDSNSQDSVSGGGPEEESVAEPDEELENVSQEEPWKLPQEGPPSGSQVPDDGIGKTSDNESKAESEIISEEEPGKESGKASEDDSGTQDKISGTEPRNISNMEPDLESSGKSAKKSEKGVEKEPENDTEGASGNVSDEESEELSKTEEELVQVPETIIEKGPDNVTVEKSETESIKESEKEPEEETGTVSGKERREESDEDNEESKGIENKWLSNHVTHGAAETLSTASGIGETEEESQMRNETHVSAEEQERSEKQTASDNSFETVAGTAAQTAVYLNGIKIDESETLLSKEAAKETEFAGNNLNGEAESSKLHGTDILLPESIDPSATTQLHAGEINDSKRSEGLNAPQENTGKGYEPSKLNLRAGSLMESSIRNKEQDIAEQREGKTVANDVNTVQASDSSSTSGSKFSGNSDTSREDNISSAAINQVSEEEPGEEKITGSNAEDHSSKRNDSKMISNLSLKSSERNEVREKGKEKMASTRVEEELRGSDVKPNLSNIAKLPTNENSDEPRDHYSTRLDNPEEPTAKSLSDDEQSVLAVPTIDATNKSNDPWTSVTQKQAETPGRNGLNDPHNEEDEEEAPLNESESITRDLNKVEAFKEGSPSVEMTESNDVTAENGESSPTANTLRTTKDEVPLSDLGTESSRKSDKLLRKGQGTLDRSSESGTRSGEDEITKDNARESDKYGALSAARQLIENKAPGILTATSVQTALNTETTGEARSVDVNENLIVPRIPEAATLYPINGADSEGYKEGHDETTWTHEEVQVDSGIYRPGLVPTLGLSSESINRRDGETDRSIGKGGNMEKEKGYGASNNRKRLGNASKIDSSVDNGGSTENEKGNDVSSHPGTGRIKSQSDIYQYDDISVKSNDVGWGMHQDEFSYIPRTSHLTVSVDGSDYEIGSDANAVNLGEWDPSLESNPSNVWAELDVRNEDAPERHDQESYVDTWKTVSGPGFDVWDHGQNRKSGIIPVTKDHSTSSRDSYMTEQQEENPGLEDSSGNEEKSEISVHEPDMSDTNGMESQGDDQPLKSGIKILPDEPDEGSNQELEIPQNELHDVQQSTENLHEMIDNEKESSSGTERRIKELLQLKEDQENGSDEQQEPSSKVEDNHTSSMDESTRIVDLEEDTEDHGRHYSLSNRLNPTLMTDAKDNSESSLKHPSLNLKDSSNPDISNPVTSEFQKFEYATSDDSIGLPNEDTDEHDLMTTGENSIHSTKVLRTPIFKLPDQDWSTSDEHSEVNLGEINVVPNTPLTRSPANAHSPLDAIEEGTKSNDPLSRVSETRPPSETGEGIADSKIAKKLQPSFGKLTKPQAEIVNKIETSSPVFSWKFKSHSDEDEPARSVESSPHTSSGEVSEAGNKNGDLCTVFESIFLAANERDNEAPSSEDSTRVVKDERIDELQNTLQPSREQVDVYIVKQTNGGPVKIAHVEDMAPLVVTSNVISESAYEEMIDIFESNRMQTSSSAA